MKIRIITALAFSLAAGLFTHQAFAKKGGTSILHFMLRANMTGTGTGSIEAKRNQQGGADNQRLGVSVAGLDAFATYQLLASTTEDANLITVAEFTTDSNGDAVLNYVKKNQGKASPGGDPLPAGLDPISNLRSVEVSVGGTQTVLSVDITTPNSLQYLVKRAMTNDGVEPDAAASLRIKSNGRKDQLWIRASGLSPTNAYYLAVNETIAADLASDLGGNLKVTKWQSSSSDILDITSLAIWNSMSNSVLSTTLP